MERTAMDMGAGSDKTVTLIVHDETFEDAVRRQLDWLNTSVQVMGDWVRPVKMALRGLADKWGDEWANKAFGIHHANHKIEYRMHRRADRQRLKREKI
jgi:hypothetical protein